MLWVYDINESNGRRQQGNRNETFRGCDVMVVSSCDVTESAELDVTNQLASTRKGVSPDWTQ